MKEFNLIPMSDIRPDVIQIAVSWAEANKYEWIGDKHKLASDIQNYADYHAKNCLEANTIKIISYSITSKKENNIKSKLEDVISNGVVEGEEVDITTAKVFNQFIKPLLLLIDSLKQV